MLQFDVRTALLLLPLAFPSAASAAKMVRMRRKRWRRLLLPPMTGRRINLVGEAISASEGLIGRAEVTSRPLLRAGDLLEFVPRLVATQHSGSRKANQYFLRAFNLDHGMDCATFVDAMPVNMRSHGHGQGWTGLNFLIAEAVEQLRYRKGLYHADVGDFSSAGSA